MTVQHSIDQKWVYLFEEGTAEMRDLLGGKGAGLAEMTQAQLPVPPGFTVTTEACNAYAAEKQFPDGMWDQLMDALKVVERKTQKGFGDAENPLLVSVRSGASISMPGMMDTVLNLGLNHMTTDGIARSSGNERFAYDAYRRFVQMFGRIVLDIDGEHFDSAFENYKRDCGANSDTDLTSEHLRDIVATFLEIVENETGAEFPQDPYQQLELATKAVFSSWSGKRAIDYRNFYKIPHDLGTAVNVVAMVFGNMGDSSGTGVAFTRDPSTGEKTLYGEYLIDAQGEDVVAGIRTPSRIAELKRVMPEQYAEFLSIAERLENYYKDAQDLEFTIENGKLYMLQTRSAKRTAQAAVKIAVDMVQENIISKEEALRRIEPNQINQLLLPRFDDRAREEAERLGDLLGSGLNASPGAASGVVVFDPDQAEKLGEEGNSVILVRPETAPEDVHGMIHAKGVLTSRGGATSHAAVVARGLGKPCVAGVEELDVNVEQGFFVIGDRKVEAGEEISIDGGTGQIYAKRLPTIDPNFSEEKDLVTLLGWADEVRNLGVWANADYPRDAQRALDFGAEGIGLCRTEHMFFEEERRPIVQRMILAAGKATRLEQELQQEIERQDQATNTSTADEAEILKKRKEIEESADVQDYHDALSKLLEFQVEDFKGILKVMDGKPVIIRLLDPPLHEFLPPYDELLVDVTKLRLASGPSDELEAKEHLLAMIEEMQEINPMLGLRGCRLGLMYGAINEMQAKAIFTASVELVLEGFNPKPEIMVPLVGHVNELRLVRLEIEAIGEAVQEKLGAQVAVKIGTMIELPRAALTADQIAEHAQFFSFGTNDLTQTTFGYSRDDAESSFLLDYVKRGILEENPFQVLDRDGVGQLIQTAVERGRSTYQDLEVGICGEHGGDPSSIEFCHQTGLDYVSASPFRVPIARLAAAQAVLGM